eukprot:COSAG06_NODE_21565_length_752_cov_32.431853_2_plen_213_part_01
MGRQVWSTGALADASAPHQLEIDLGGTLVDAYLWGGCPAGSDGNQLIAYDLAGNRLMARYGSPCVDQSTITTQSWTAFTIGGGYSATEFVWSSGCTPVDCAGQWSACTAACETASQREFIVSQAPYGGGSDCTPGSAIDCAEGEDDCPNACPAGQYSSGASCISCDAGRYGAAGETTSQCTGDCAAGRYSEASTAAGPTATDCIECDAGRYGA